MKITRKPIIPNISDTPLVFEFIGEEYIWVHAHEKTKLYSFEGELLHEFPFYSNGTRGLFVPLPNGHYSVWRQIFNEKFEPLKKRFKAPKKSMEGYYSLFPKIDHEHQHIIVGFFKGGVGIYDYQYKVIKHVELGRSIDLIKVDFESRRGYGMDSKKGILKIYAYPSFELLKEFKVGRSNSSFVFGKNFIFNYGYTAANYLIDLKTEKIKVIRFHPTNKKGYKEQYDGEYNFGVDTCYPNATNDLIALRTAKDKCFLFKPESHEIIDLKIHEHFDFDPFLNPMIVHRGRYTMYRAIFIGDRLYTNIGDRFVIWDLEGNLIAENDGPNNIGHDGKGNLYALEEGDLFSFEVTE